MSTEILTRDEKEQLSSLLKKLGSKLGKIGGPARAAALSPERRKEIAAKASAAGLIVRRANAAARKAAKEANGPTE